MSQNRWPWLAFGTLLIVVAACALQPAVTVDRDAVAMNDLCPLYTSGATIEFARVDGGGALTFTKGPTSVLALRGRTRRVVAMHNERLDARVHHGRSSVSAKVDIQRMPNATASVADVPGGARVVLVPSDASELASLRNHLRTHAGRMSGVECPELWRETPSSTLAPL